MKEIVPPSPPPLVHNQNESVRELFSKNLVPSHGAGSYLFDVAGKRYLDLGAGIAVCCLGHAHPAITEALVEQSKKLIHVSNLYFTEPKSTRLNSSHLGISYAVSCLKKKKQIGCV